MAGRQKFVSPTPARGNANGISEIIKQKEKGAVIVPGAYAPGPFFTWSRMGEIVAHAIYGFGFF